MIEARRLTDPPGTVMHVILSQRLAGTERHVAELCSALRLRGWRTLVATRENLDAVLRREYERVSELHQLPLVPFPLLVPALARLTRSERVTVLHGHLGDGTFAALGAAALTSRPIVSTAHFVTPRHAQGFGRTARALVYRKLMTRVDAVVAISDAVREALREAYVPDHPPVHRIHNGVGTLPDGETGDGSTGDSLVMFAGRLEEEKQVDLLIRALAQVAQPCDLWVAGEGSQREYLQRLAESVAPGRVRFLGFVADVPPLLARARVIAVPSRGEPFGLSVVEAMRAARPVVGFAAGALPEIVSHGETGLLVKPGDVRGLAGALQSLVADEDRARTMGRAGRRRYEDCFTADRMATETEALYARLAGERC